MFDFDNIKADFVYKRPETYMDDNMIYDYEPVPQTKAKCEYNEFVAKEMKNLVGDSRPHDEKMKYIGQLWQDFKKTLISDSQQSDMDIF